MIALRKRELLTEKREEAAIKVKEKFERIRGTVEERERRREEAIRVTKAKSMEAVENSRKAAEAERRERRERVVRRAREKEERHLESHKRTIQEREAHFQHRKVNDGDMWTAVGVEVRVC